MIYIPFFIVILIDKRDDKRDDTKNDKRTIQRTIHITKERSHTTAPPLERSRKKV